MDTSEMKSLEEKTRAIVETLSNLERETKRQKRMSDQLEQGKTAILTLSSELSATADRLADAIDLLRRSTLSEDIDRLDTKLDEVKGLADLVGGDVRRAEEMCRSTAELASKAESSVQEVRGRLDAIETSCTDLASRLDAIGEDSARRDAELARRLENLEDTICRIDRNTQRGFGKERGKHAAY